MRHFSIGCVFFYSALSFASCPNLEGTYTCSLPNNTTGTSIITQSVSNGITTYTQSFGENSPVAEHIADNVTRTIADSSEEKNITSRNWCEGNSWIEELNLDLYQNNSLYAKLHDHSSTTPTTGGYKYLTGGIIIFPDGSSQIESTEVNCTLVTE